MSKSSPDPEAENSSLAAYAGRWIARLWDRVVGQVGTPKQALQAAISARHKETPQVSFVPTSSPLKFSPLFSEVQAALPENQTVYLVGGAIRDAFLKRESIDLDFALAKDALKTARRVAKELDGSYYRMDEEHQTGRVILVDKDGSRNILDFANLRGPDLESDLRGRDFTINAMAVDVRQPQELLDPMDGLADLFAKQVRGCSPMTFQDDPVRVLRAVRFAAGLGFQIQKETRQAAKEAAGQLPQVSAERIRDELFKILMVPKSATSIRALDILGVLKFILPELPPLKGVTQPLPHVSDVWDHTLHTVQHLENLMRVLDQNFSHDNESGGDLVTGLVSLRLGRYRGQFTEHLNQHLNMERPYKPLLILAALYHDAAKPATRREDDGEISFPDHPSEGAKLAAKRAEALHLTNTEVERLKMIVRHHQLPRRLARETVPPSHRLIYQYFRETGQAGVDVVLLSMADLLARYGTSLPHETLSEHLDIMRALLDAYWENPEQVNPSPLIDGNDLITNLKLQPGPKVGEILEIIREAQAVGEITTRKEALTLAKESLN